MESKEQTPQVVTFDGSKCFWKTRNTVDILIVEQDSQNSIEVIVYEPTFNRESPRIYLDKNALTSKIDPTVVDEKLRAAKEQHLRRHEIPDVLQLLHKINQTARVEYILNRLFITEFIPETRTMTLGIQFNFRDRDEELDCGIKLEDMITARPTGLVPYVSHHHDTLMLGTVLEALQAIELAKEAAGLHKDTKLTVREKWRIPIVMKKVANGGRWRMGVNDAKIWSVISRRMAPPKDCDMKQLIETTLATGIVHTKHACKGARAHKKGFTKQKTVRQGLQASGADTIKEDVVAEDSADLFLKPLKTKAAAPPSTGTATVGGGFSAGFSAVATSFKKHLGLSKSATAPQLPSQVPATVPEKEEPNSTSHSVSTTRLYRAATTGSVKPEAGNLQAKPAGVSRGPKSGVLKSSPSRLKVQSSIIECATLAPSPVSSRFTATLSSFTESLRNSFSFKMGSAEAALYNGSLMSLLEEEGGVLHRTPHGHDLSGTDKTPLLSRRPSFDEGETVCAPGLEGHDSSRTKPEATKLQRTPHGAAALPGSRPHGNIADADSVTPTGQAEPKKKQPAAKQAKSGVSAKPVAETKLPPAARSWLNFRPQNKTVAFAEPTAEAGAAPTPAEEATGAGAQCSSEDALRVAQSHVDLSTHQLQLKRQLYTEQPTAKVRADEPKNATGARDGAPAPAITASTSTLRQVWGSILGKENHKHGRVAPAD